MGTEKSQIEIIPFDDKRMNYYYAPWQVTGQTIRTANYNDYVDLWYIKLTRLEWWSQKGPTHGIAGFKIAGSKWEIHEMINLYSPTQGNIELIKAWNFDPDDYIITLLNIGETDPEAMGNDLVHAYFKVHLAEVAEAVSLGLEVGTPEPKSN